MKNLKITVVTVCYNAVDTIERTILSVINQTYSNIEYIVIDGSSSDGTVDIIKKYSDRMSKWVSEADNGIYDAMNKGTDLATGEWINFMNAGDLFVNEQVIADIVPVLRDGYDVVFGNTILTTGHSNKFWKGWYRDNTIPEFCHQSSFILTRTMRQYRYATKYIIAADTDFFYRLYKNKGTFYYVDTDVSLSNMNGLSSNNRAIVYREACEVFGNSPSRIKMLKYRIEDAMPIWFMKRLLSFVWFLRK